MREMFGYTNRDMLQPVLIDEAMWSETESIWGGWIHFPILPVLASAHAPEACC